LINELDEKRTEFIVFIAYYLFYNQQYFPVREKFNMDLIDTGEPIKRYLKNKFYPLYRSEFVIKRNFADYTISLYHRRD